MSDDSRFEDPWPARFCEDFAFLDTLRLWEDELARLRSSVLVREGLPCCVRDDDCDWRCEDEEREREDEPVPDDRDDRDPEDALAPELRCAPALLCELEDERAFLLLFASCAIISFRGGLS